MRKSRGRTRLGLGAALLAMTLACGGLESGMGNAHGCAQPYDDYSLLFGDVSAALRSPVGRFDDEMQRVVAGSHRARLEKVARGPVVAGPEDAWERIEWKREWGKRAAANTQARELEEIGAALKTRGVEETLRGRILEEVRQYRLMIETLRRQTTGLPSEDLHAGNEQRAKVWPVLDAQVPEQYCLYLEGMKAYVLGDVKGARERFEKVLALAGDAGRQRAVWAAYMTGRTYEKEPQAAVKWFKKTRELATAGWPDPLFLAAESLGWEARARLDMKDHLEALRLYLSQVGTQTGGNVDVSVQYTVAQVLGDDGLCAKCAQDPLARDMVTAYLVGNGGAWAHFNEEVDGPVLERWARALDKVKPQSGQANADRLAWVCYQAGQFVLARKWVDLSPAQSCMGRWINAKLLMRAGKDKEAAAILEALGKEPEFQKEWRGYYHPSFFGREEAASQLVVGEQAAIKVKEGKFLEAARLMRTSTADTDAIYLAERVLTIDELTRMCNDKGWDAAAMVAPQEKQASGVYDSRPEAMRELMRGVLATRLVRAGKYDAAQAYMSSQLGERLQAMQEAMARGRDIRRPALERGRELFKAARIMRENGMELMGTYLGPDNGYANGNSYENAWLKSRQAMAVFEPTDEEIRRFNQPGFPTRWLHYRFVAAYLAWEALALMPNESDETARMFCEAGGWIKVLDPKAADRFYKALVKRCGKTQLGMAAEKKRWFPVVPGKEE